MDLLEVGKQLAKIGLPILGTAIAGPAGAAIGQLLGNAIGKPEAAPEEIFSALAGSSEALQKAKEFEATHAATILKMHLDALQSSDKNQTDVNLADAGSGSFFKSGWRPAAGWTCVSALFYQFLARPLGGWIMQQLLGWQLPPSLETDTLMTLLFGLLGLGAYRTVERIRGKA
jgi:hypothetical protein